MITEPLNALYIVSRRNSERCRRQLNVATFALPSADISLRRRSLVGRQRSERQRERESKWRTQSEANPQYYRGLAVRNNVNHTLSSA